MPKRFFVEMAISLMRELIDIPAEQVYVKLNKVEGLGNIPVCVRSEFNKVLRRVNWTLKFHKARGYNFSKLPYPRREECILLLLLVSYEWQNLVIPPKPDMQRSMDYLVQYFITESSIERPLELRFYRRLLGLCDVYSPMDIDEEAGRIGFSEDVDCILEVLGFYEDEMD